MPCSFILGDNDMQMILKQKFFSWFDRYEINDESGNLLFIVEGKLSWGHCLKIHDASHQEIGMVQEKLLSFLPRFELYIEGEHVGTLSKDLSWFRPRYHIDYNGWQVEGDFMGWDYRVLDSSRKEVAVISKELMHWSDTYEIEVFDPKDALGALMIVLSIDAEKCSRNE